MTTRALVLLALALTACDAYTEKRHERAPVDAGADGDGGACTDTRDGYPDGPYGKSEGDVIANLSFQDKDAQPVSFGDLHAPCKQKLLVLTTSAGWCTACREEQPKLQALYDDYRDRGLVVMVGYFENDDFEPGTVRQVADWVRRYHLTFPVVLDEAFQLGDYYDRSLTPMVMIVDLETMRIVKIQTAYDDSVVRALVSARL